MKCFRVYVNIEEHVKQCKEELKVGLTDEEISKAINDTKIGAAKNKK